MSIFTKQRHGLGLYVQSSLGNSLPAIRGRWFGVDPGGVSLGTAPRELGLAGVFSNLSDAYTACTTNVGDGIVVFASDADTAANTTSYLHVPLVWVKNSITVVGLCAPVRTFQRARISNKQALTSGVSVVFSATAQTIVRAADSFITDGWVVGMTGKVDASGTNSARTFTVTAVSALTLTCTADDLLAETAASHTLHSTQTILLNVTGHNNTFANLHLTHGGTHVTDLTCLKVSGDRNAFINVHAAMGIANAITNVTTRSLWLIGHENTFHSCTFGTDTVDRGNNASFDVYVSGAVKRNRFIDCETIAYVSTGVAKLAAYFDGTVGGSPTLFDNCRFVCNNVTEQTAALGGTGSNDKIWLTGGTCHPGYSALGLGTVAYISGANIAAGVGGKLTTTA